MGKLPEHVRKQGDGTLGGGWWEPEGVKEAWQGEKKAPAGDTNNRSIPG